jgi:tetratricopeptide (TPR) repeat protein
MKLRAALLLVLLLAAGLPAQEDDVMVLSSPYASSEGREGKSMLPIESKLKTSWFSALSYLKQGQASAAKAEVQKMVQEAQAQELVRLTPFAHSMLGLTQGAMDAGDLLKAQTCLEMADLLDPHLPEAALLRAQWAWRMGSYPAAAVSLAHFAAQAAFTSPIDAILKVDAAFLAAAEIVVLTLFFALFLFVGQFYKVLHDARELFADRVAPAGLPVVALAVLFLPVVLGLNWWWLLAWVLVITFGYATPAQRGVALLLLLLFALTGPLLYLTQTRMVQAHSPIIQTVRAQAAAQVSYPYIGDLEIIQGIVGTNPDLMFLIGTVYQMGDDGVNAMAAYRSVLEADPNHLYARLNLGNLYYWQNQFGAAIAEYQKAQSIDPNYIPAYFNLSKAYNANYEYTKGQDIIRAANAVNAGQMSKLLSNPPKRDVVVAFLSPAEAWGLRRRLDEGGALRGKGIRGHERPLRPLEGILHPLFLAGALGLVGAVGLHAYRRRHGGYAGICTKCGRTFCTKCKSASESQIYCTQCIHIYIKKDGVPLETKVRKMKEVKNFLGRTLWSKKLMNALFPGYALLLQEKTLKGMLVFIAFSLLVMAGIHPAPFALTGFSSPVLGILAKAALGLAAALWVAVNAKVIVEKGGS